MTGHLELEGGRPEELRGARRPRDRDSELQAPELRSHSARSSVAFHGRLTRRSEGRLVDGTWTWRCRRGRSPSRRRRRSERSWSGSSRARVRRRSDRLKSFLRFVVEETLAGRADRLKAYTIALEVLGRDESFDPQNDPVVRMEAGKLRRRLERYYLGAGRDDPVRIEIPKGGYAPTFSLQPDAEGGRRGAAGADPSFLVRRSLRRRADGRWAGSALAALVCSPSIRLAIRGPAGRGRGRPPGAAGARPRDHRPAVREPLRTAKPTTCSPAA